MIPSLISSGASRALAAALAVSLAGLTISACSSTSSSTNGAIVGDNGVDDVNKACVIRSGWTQSNSSACGRCIGLAEEPRCACADVDYAGACASQGTAVNAIAGCTDARTCASACKQSDCNCVSACYAGKTDCQNAAAALDGCLAEICAPSCE